MTSSRARLRTGITRIVGVLGTLAVAAGVLLAVPTAAVAAETVNPVVAPSVSGDCVVFETRTVDPGVWPAGYEVSGVQWFREGPYGGPAAYGNPGLSTQIGADLTPTGSPSFLYALLYPVITVTKTADGSSFDWGGDLSCYVEAAAANTPVSAPKIVSGSVRVDRTVTLSTGEWAETDGWTFTGRFYFRNNPWLSTTPTPSSDSSVSTSLSYTFPAQSVNQYVRFTVTATKPGHAPATTLVDIGKVGAGDPPVVVTPPSVQGSPTVGSTITPSFGTWSVDKLTFICGWYRDGVRIGDCGPLTLQPADLGKSYYIRVMGERLPAYPRSAAATSAAVVIGPGPAPVPVRGPAINGTTTVGQTITLDKGDWNVPGNATFSFQWFRDGVAVPQRTSASYAIGANDGGARLSATVTVTVPGYQTANVSTSPTAPVGKGPRPTLQSAPTVSGTAAVGETLTASPGTWSKDGLTFKYTWLRNGIVIDGQLASTYRPVAGDVGKRIGVRVTVTSNAWSTTTATSANTAPIALGAKPTLLQAPAISGSLQVGRVLSVTTGTWSRSGLTYGYQWFADGVAISGATSSTVTLTSAQRGKAITAKVIVTRDGYATAAAITAATARIS